MFDPFPAQVTKRENCDRKQPLALVHLASRLLDRDGPLRCWGYNFLALVTIAAAKRTLHRPAATSAAFEDALADACKKAVERGAGKGRFNVTSTRVVSKRRPRDKHGALCVRPER